MNNTRLHNTIVKNVNRCRDTVHQEATRGQEGHYKEGRSLTLPSARRCLASSVAVEEDEMSDTVSEKGENMIISQHQHSFEDDLTSIIPLPRLRLHGQRLQVLEPAEPGPGQEELRRPGDIHGGLLHPGGEL